MVRLFVQLVAGYYPVVTYKQKHRKLGHAIKLAAKCLADKRS
jgi:hypothetical protein